MKSVVLTLLLSLVLTSPLWCQETEDTPLTLDQCISIALDRNPLILSSSAYYRAALARINQAKSIPQPVIGYDSDLQPTFFNFKDSAESYFGVSQSLEFPMKTVYRGRVATAESDELLADADLLKLDLVLQVKEAFYGLLNSFFIGDCAS